MKETCLEFQKYKTEASGWSRLSNGEREGDEV